MTDTVGMRTHGRRRGHRLRGAFVVAAALLCLLAGCRLPQAGTAAGAGAPSRLVGPRATFVPNEARMSDPRENVGDPEYEPQTLRMTYFNRGDVWVVSLGAGGMIDLAAREWVDSGVVIRPDPRTVIKNGPEWGQGQSGWDLFYTKVDDQGLPYMVRARRMGEDAWTSAAIENSKGRLFPMPSIDASDPSPRILYGAPGLPSVPHGVVILWRYADEALDHRVPGDMLLLNGPSRWVEGQRRVSVSTIEAQAEGSVSQVALYDIETGVMEKVTANTSPDVIYDEVWCVRAPEYDDRYVVWAVENRVSGGRILSNTVKLFVPGEAGGWYEARSLRPSTADPATPFIISPEPFVYGGRSYIAMLMSPTPVQKRELSHVWIMNLEGFERQLTPPDAELSRTEPEPLAIEGAMYVYFSAQVLDQSGKGTGNKMIYRSATGL